MLKKTLITPRPISHSQRNHGVGAADKGIFGEEIETLKQIKSMKANGTYGTVGLIEIDRVLRRR